MKKEVAVLTVLLILTGLFWQCAPAEKPPVQAVFRGTTMGTFYTIKVIMANPDSGKRELIHREIKEVLKVVNAQMSIFDPQSEISRFNKYQQLDWFPVSRQTVTVLGRAQTISGKSMGAFDVTVAPLINAWGFGNKGRQDLVPSEATISDLKEMVGFQKLHVRIQPSALKKDFPALSVNLSAIAKGYGVDQVAEYLTGAGHTNFLVEIGGEIAARGRNLQGGGWKIGVATPQDQPGVQTIIPLSDLAMATSGDYRNFFKVKGKRYSHTIDARTGKPIEHNLASVTVVHQSCTMADAWATALHVLGPVDGYTIAKNENLLVLFIIRSAQGFEEKKTPPFAALISEKNN